MLLLYNILALLLWPLSYFSPVFRGTVLKRLGNFPLMDYDPQAKGLKVLVNAVSAGEVVAIASFVRELKRRHPEAQVALTTTTISGQEMALRKLEGELSLLIFFPLIDLLWVVRRYLDRLRPDLYVSTESELWPNIQSACRRRGIPVALVNARLYLHNKRGLRGWIVRRLYSLCDLIVCQNAQQRANFITLGVPESRLAVSGNTKFDFDVPHWDEAFLAAQRERYGVADCPVVVAGSTHEGEEALLLKALTAARERNPAVRLILAPRHAERAEEAAALAAARGFRVLRLSAHEEGAPWDVLVVDRYGVLMDFYRLATVVVMGGTFHRRVGGHNILEATVLGKPVICGPHTFSITAQVEMLAAVDGLVRVAAGNELGGKLAGLLAEPERAAAIGRAAQQATLANRGASARAADAVLALVGEKGR